MLPACAPDAASSTSTPMVAEHDTKVHIIKNQYCRLCPSGYWLQSVPFLVQWCLVVRFHCVLYQDTCEKMLA